MQVSGPINRTFILNEMNKAFRLIKVSGKGTIQREIKIQPNPGDYYIQHRACGKQNDDQFASLSEDGVLRLFSFDLSPSQSEAYKKLSEIKIWLLEGRNESVISLAVCPRNTLFAVYTRKIGSQISSRLMLYSPKKIMFQLVAVIDLWKQRMNCFYNIEFIGYLKDNSGVFLVGVTDTSGTSEAFTYQYNRRKDDLEEIGDLRKSFKASKVSALVRNFEGDLVCCDANGKKITLHYNS